jgi:hypothetical protein
MTHKIYMSAKLRSVQPGNPSILVGFCNSVHAYSNVAFPAEPRNCQRCYQGTPRAGSGKWGRA